MSTRAQIVVEGSPVLVYVHQDAAPEDILPVLEEQVQFFVRERGHTLDPAYCVAQIVRAFGVEDYRCDQARGALARNAPARRTLGWGLGTTLHTDIDWLYLVRRDGQVTVYQVDWPEPMDAPLTPDALAADPQRSLAPTTRSRAERPVRTIRHTPIH